MSSTPSRPRTGMTAQTKTAASSAVVFVALSLLLAFVPIPFVVWSPGAAHNLLGTSVIDGQSADVIDVEGMATYPVKGQLDLVTISESRPDSLVTLPEALLAHWLPQRDVLPRELLYPPGMSASQIQAEDAVQMNVSQHDAVVAALRAAGRQITTLPVVTVVNSTGKAYGLLQPGDFVVAIDGKKTTTPEDVRAVVHAHKVSDKLRVSFLRDGAPGAVTIDLVASNQDDTAPTLGVKVETGYSHEGRIRFLVSPTIGGPSGGLAFALGLYDRIARDDVIAGRHIAATGTMSSKGEVGAIGGVQEKIGAAEQAGATIFLMPRENCKDIGGMQTNIRVVPVQTLDEALKALKALQDPTHDQSQQGVPSCR